MLLRVDPTSDVPLFAQLAGSLRADIARGILRVGDRIPAAKEVAQALQINVHTVLRAYQELREEGLVDIRRGRGVIVTDAAAALAALHADALALVTRANKVGVSADALAALIKEVGS